MVIDLGIVGDFVNSRKFWGSMAIGFPVFTVAILVVYSLVKKIPFLKNIVQYITLTYGLSIIVFMPIVFFSAFLETEKLKLALIYFVILFFVSIFTLFNQKEVINFLKDFSNTRGFTTKKSQLCTRSFSQLSFWFYCILKKRERNRRFQSRYSFYLRL